MKQTWSRWFRKALALLGVVWKPLVGVAVFSAVVLTGYRWLSAQAKANAERPSAASGWLYLGEGAVEATEVNLSAKIPGRIASIYVDEGERVRRGEVVVVLESEEIDAKVRQAQAGLEATDAQLEQARLAVQMEALRAEDQVRQAKASVEAARARWEMAQNGARPEEIRQAEQAVEAAKAQFTVAQKTWNRMEALAKEGVIPQQKADEAEGAFLAAQAQLQAAEAKLQLARDAVREEEKRAAWAALQAAEANLQLAEHARLQVQLRLRELQALQAKRDVSRAQVDEARAYQKQTLLRAPVDGIVSRKMAEVGEVVAAGMPVLTVAQEGRWWVEVFADESIAGRVERGEEVQVELPALGRRVAARVTRILPAADFATRRATNERGSFDIRSLHLRVEWSQPVSGLVKGMTARVYIRKG
ncbi:MAG: HlyD family efflux transporter periplasmic adaptor subunit [Armatimonadota bacterium]|nr:HlyD family efflux transporter periplasmic adaptor subunit [bacterium]MDW8105298.1 HlyD family efflux transporter periplasmic adaptor subunit [Armatimonadota bacterium]MDW8290153.1 HlyD family efflux transporter periplasmic adaptor subunit [Armatimonadota bacterium]